MKLPRAAYNWLSLSGAIIALFSLFMIIFLFIISFFLKDGSSYLGIIMYIVLPIFLVLGLLLIPIGMLIKIRRDKKRAIQRDLKWPEINFNLARHRNAAAVFVAGTVIFILISAIGSYEAFHYTESVEFCGTICHQVMEPEYVAYQNSSHARVPCVGCHVGPGASWYVKSKMSGLYQVYAVVMDNYPRPIPTPVHNLRPARETCERCHWPQKFYARSHRVEKHYLADEANTEWNISLQMKTGPEVSSLGLQEGIHWHINPDVQIDYIATPDRERIPWVRYTNKKTGESYTYTDQGVPYNLQSGDSLEKRTMDCMDCHNRPSHSYSSPMKYINNAMAAGQIPLNLPDIKIVSMAVLNIIEFPTLDSAYRHIERETYAYYSMLHEDSFKVWKPMIDKSIAVMKHEYSKNAFPAMKVTWKKYPNHIGHLESDGCFRCHNDRHRTSAGRVISMDCNLCHSITAQGPANALMATTVFGSLEFLHPNDEAGGWKGKLCSECHHKLYQE
jgi:hypothetical protein